MQMGQKQAANQTTTKHKSIKMSLHRLGKLCKSDEKSVELNKALMQSHSFPSAAATTPVKRRTYRLGKVWFGSQI